MAAYYSYYNDYLPYSMQHGIKGAEFENVLVVYYPSSSTEILTKAKEFFGEENVIPLEPTLESA